MSAQSSRIRNMTLQEASIVSEQLLHLLQTVAENYYQLEDAQRFSLMQIAYNISADIDGWMNAEEERKGGATKHN